MEWETALRGWIMLWVALLCLLAGIPGMLEDVPEAIQVSPFLSGMFLGAGALLSYPVFDGLGRYPVPGVARQAAGIDPRGGYGEGCSHSEKVR